MKDLKFYLLALFLLIAGTGFAQNTSVAGTVIDEKGEPMIGVSIRLKSNPSVGAATNLDGKFTISVPKPNEILTVTFIGYVAQEVTAKGTTPLTITLVEEQTTLNEVVVVGYQDVKKRDLTGSVAKADLEDMLKAPVASFDQALAGRIAGVNVSSSEGSPGNDMNIVIRGNNSVTQDNSPLYVIDGFPIEDPRAGAAINPNDIESIDVLKDASATAIYGARGANGVIIISTKKGKAGELQINYDGNFGVQRVTKTIPMMDAYEFVRLQQEVIDPTQMVGENGYYKTYNGKTYTLEDYRNVDQYNWQDMIFRDATQQSHSLTLNGGTAGNRYNASLSYFDQDGIVLASNFNRIQGRLSNTIRKNKLNVNLSVNYSNSTQNGRSPSQSTFSGMNNLFYSVWGYRPVTQPGVPLSYLKDNAFDDNVDTSVDYRFNPILSLENENAKNNTTYIQFNGFAEYEFMKGLKLKVSGGYTTDFRKFENFNNSKSRYGSPISIDKVNATVRNSQRHTWLNENILTYQTTIQKKHSLNALAGVTFQNSDFKYYSTKTTQIPNESLGMAGMAQGMPNLNESAHTEWSMLSYLARLNYNYASKYYATTSFRADGSSKFREKNLFGYFPSASLAWSFTEEDFMKRYDWLDAGKLRVSWGMTGNNRVGEYDTYARIAILQGGDGNYTDPLRNGYGVYSFNNQIVAGSIPLTLPNIDLKWETTSQWNIGLDLGFFKDRVNVTVDLYDKITHDLLLNAVLPVSSGYGSAMKNIGKVQNRGLEFTLNTVNIAKKDFRWTSNFNIAFNRNKVLALADNQRSLISQEIVDRNFNGDNYIAKIGYPIGMMYGYIYEGTYKLDEFDQVGGNYILKPGVARYVSENNTQPGFPKYKDLNEDGVINSDDQTFIGRGEPIHVGGFTNNFQYKNWDLNVFFQWSYGSDIVNANLLMFETSFSRRRDLNQFASYANRWTFDNPTSDIPRVNNSSSNLLYSSRIIEDGSYLRLKTLSLGYNIPTSAIKKIGLTKARLNLTAQNLFTLSNYSGYDPEVSIRDKALTPNLDFSAYPRAASLNFGVNLSF